MAAKVSSYTTRALYESLSAYGTLWPRDALRPDVSFGQSVVRAAERALCNAQQLNRTPPPQASSSQGVQSHIDTRQLSYREQLDERERANVLRAIDALRFIREGRASKEFPVPTSILEPQANPIYYTRLADMLAKASKGEKVALTFAQRVRIFFGLPI